MQKLKPESLDYINNVLEKDFSPEEVSRIEVNSEDGDFDLYSEDGTYVDTIPKEAMSVDISSLVEQNEQGIGRPKIKQYKIKRNRLKFTIANVADGVWYFLPMITIAAMKEFLYNIDCQSNVIEITSKILRGGVAVIAVPENREPYLKEVLRKGSEGNPYYKGKDATNVNAIKHPLK